MFKKIFCTPTLSFIGEEISIRNAKKMKNRTFNLSIKKTKNQKIKKKLPYYNKICIYYQSTLKEDIFWRRHFYGNNFRDSLPLK